MAKVLNQYEAATLLTISPELLFYCTSYTVKTDNKRKLSVAKKENGLSCYDQDELKD